ncbi:MAG: hypothetical protein RIS94_3425 [Pseudomonadota bacterium]|jgi:hypothetical protein
MNGPFAQVIRRALPALLPVTLCLGCAVPSTAPLAAEGGTAAMHLPARELRCNVGHATNLDATRQQRRDEITFDSHHAIVIRLPSIAARTTPPPDATEPAEPVDPGTRVTEDPDHLLAATTGPFNRVIDLWPDRVEMTMPMAHGLSKLLIVSDFDSAAQSAQLFITDAQDLATFDLTNTFLGDCRVQMTPPETSGS